jgi:prepilin-type N-terminal cleavage/methylation domain-containing protein/prepilin-type processing-associated H-X9-DG protein
VPWTRSRRGGAAVAREGDCGFTIIEILVVIGIIALLTAILLPALSKARASANSLTCEKNLQQMAQAIQYYISDSRGILPYGYWDGTFNPLTGSDLGFNAVTGADWTILLQREISTGGLKAMTRGIFFDPDAPLGNTTNSLGLTIAQYACHPRLMPLMGTEDKYAELAMPPGVKCYLRPYNIARIRRSSEMALIFDASLAALVGGGYSVMPQPVALDIDNSGIYHNTYLTDQYNLAPAVSPTNGINMTPNGTGPINSDNPQNVQNIRFRHNNNQICNVLMVDFHVESFSWTTAAGTNLHRQNINVNP